MKTIKETEKEYSDYEAGEYVFKKGFEFAQRWIPIEEDLPVFEGKEFQILVKGHKDNPDKVVCWTVGIAENESVIRSIFTHWRPIEFK